MMRRVYYRCDANRAIGYGHFFRCLAIAERAAGSFEAVFLQRDPDPFIKNEILTRGFDLMALKPMDLRDEAVFLAREILSKDAFLVMDGYDFTFEYQSLAKNSGCKTIYVDDLHAWPIAADVVVNHSPGADNALYKGLVDARTKLFTGLRYAMIRKCFIDNRLHRRTSDAVTDVMICLGGSEQHLLASELVRGILKIDHIRKLTLVSEPRPDIPVDTRLSQVSGLSGSQMAELMRSHQLIVCPPSTLSIEAFFSGMCLMLIQTAENQRDILAGMRVFSNVGVLDRSALRHPGWIVKVSDAIDTWTKMQTLSLPFPIQFDSHELLGIFE